MSRTLPDSLRPPPFSVRRQPSQRRQDQAEREALARTVSCPRVGCGASVRQACRSVVTGLVKAQCHDARRRAVAGLVTS